jgi:hypothetical protein
MENLSYIAATGRYYLRVYPWVAPPATTTYSFMVSTTATYDAGEANDNVWQANAYANSIDVSRTIDNVYDEDWYSLTVNTYARAHTISLNNVPSGGQYVVAIYDTGLNLLNYVTSTGSAGIEYKLNLGTYYLRVFSVNGVYSASQNYNLVVSPDYSVPFTANGGEAIEVATSGVYINGTKINLDWSSAFYPPGQNPGKYQYVATNTTTKVGANSIARGTLTCGTFFAGSSWDMSTTNCIRVLISNVSYMNYSLLVQQLYFPSSMFIYIDVNKQKVVEAQINSYNSSNYENIYKHTFNLSQVITS